MKNLKRQDRNGVRTAIDLERRYKFNDIELTAEEVEYLKQFMEVDSFLSTSSIHPVQNNVITKALNTKVNKEEGKELSSNDFTDELLNKLNNMTENPEVVTNKVTSIDSTCTDTQYPSAKAVYNKLQEVGGTTVEDTLTSTSTQKALSANQGRILNEGKIDNTLPIIADCNDTSLKTGFYYANASCLNVPSNSAWLIQVLYGKDTAITQIAYRYRDNEVWQRQYNTVEPSGWKEWVRMSINGTISANAGVVKIGGLKIQFGRLASVSVPATGYSENTVTFSEAFTTAPCVIVQARGNYNIKGEVQTSSTTSFIINARSVDGYARTGRSFDWIAIGS